MTPEHCEQIATVLQALGQRFRHYENLQEYMVTGYSWNVTDKCIDVLYRPLYPCEHQQFNRQFTQFFTEVEVNGLKLPRYAPILSSVQQKLVEDTVSNLMDKHIHWSCRR